MKQLPVKQKQNFGKIHPPAYLLTCLIISVLIHFILPLYNVIGFPYNLLGIILIIAGIALNIWADQIFKKQNTTVKPDKKPDVLIEKVPYSFSRNPMYLGMVLILLGVSFTLGSVAAFIGPLFFIAVMQYVFIPEEEKSMQETFGDEYFKYKRKVRKWI